MAEGARGHGEADVHAESSGLPGPRDAPFSAPIRLAGRAPTTAVDHHSEIADHAGVEATSDSSAGKFGKSRRNQAVQKAGLGLLLSDPRFQQADLPTRKKIVELLSPPPGVGPQTFDLVMKPKGTPEVTPATAEELLPHLRLVEMKATRKPIQTAALNRFFFGCTQTECLLAEMLGDRFLFAFVVLESANVYGRPFARLLTLEEVRARTRPWRTQFQVNFRADLPRDDVVADRESLIVFEKLLPADSGPGVR